MHRHGDVGDDEDEEGEEGADAEVKTPKVPTIESFEAALEVLRYLRMERNVESLEEVFTAVKAHITLYPGVHCANGAPLWTSRTKSQPTEIEEVYHISINGGEHPPPRYQARKCYICLFRYMEPHSHYPALCRPCGDFNIAESSISLPGRLKLKGKIALVTGGRVNLGYACCDVVHR